MNLSLESIRSFPSDGWDVKGENILPPNAFTDEYDWIVSLSPIYPEPVEIVLNIIEKYGGKKDSKAYQYLVRYAAYKFIKKLNTGQNSLREG